MKRVIDEKTLKALYPPMETAFETQMRQTLRSLPVERRHRGARRKPAAVLVAAAVLALLAATALAIAALSGFFTEATALPLNSSYMENWSLGEKEAVAALLVQYDLPEDRAAWEDALQESGARRREAALDALFIEHYAVTSGGRRNISLHSIMQQELGELDPEWSLEQKAAYSALESEFELGGADEDVNLLPGEDDIPREEAVQIAKDAIQAAFGFTDEQMENAALWELSFFGAPLGAGREAAVLFRVPCDLRRDECVESRIRGHFRRGRGAHKRGRLPCRGISAGSGGGASYDCVLPVGCVRSGQSARAGAPWADDHGD